MFYSTQRGRPVACWSTGPSAGATAAVRYERRHSPHLPVSQSKSPSQNLQAVRIDRWLWAARLFKTRSIAADAINNGRVQINDVRAKPAKAVKPGDIVSIRRPPYEQVLEVTALSERRVSASIAQTLYSESAASIRQREQMAETLKLGAVVEQPRHGKLNKRERRQREQLKRNFE